MKWKQSSWVIPFKTYPNLWTDSPRLIKIYFRKTVEGTPTWSLMVIKISFYVIALYQNVIDSVTYRQQKRLHNFLPDFLIFHKYFDVHAEQLLTDIMIALRDSDDIPSPSQWYYQDLGISELNGNFFTVQILGRVRIFSWAVGVLFLVENFVRFCRLKTQS